MQRTGIHPPVRKAALGAAIAVMLVACVLTTTGGARAATHAVSSATIWPNYTVTVAPRSIPTGRVVFRIKNRAHTPQQVGIDGLESSLVPPGGTVEFTVTFKRRGTYSFALPDYVADAEDGYKTTVGGSLKVT